MFIQALPINSLQCRRDFEREAKIMAKLDHAHIVRMYGVSQRADSTNLLVVLEYMDLGDLCTYLRQRSKRARMPAHPSAQVHMRTRVHYLVNHL
jgi:serine/threonine protein kinase